MEHIDHLANRVTASALTGLFLGASLATFRGRPLPKTSLSVAVSCALTGTACFASERVVHFAMGALTLRVPEDSSGVGVGDGDSIDEASIESQSQQQQEERNPTTPTTPITNNTNIKHQNHIFLSHAIGGAIGGSICGGLFQRRPWGGILLFTPVMLGVALLERRLDEWRRERIKSILKESVVDGGIGK